MRYRRRHLKADITGFGGAGAKSIDTDFITGKSVGDRLLLAAVDAADDTREDLARLAGRSIVEEWEKDMSVSETRLEECLRAGLKVSEKLSVTLLLLDNKCLGTAHTGTNRLYRISGGIITDETADIGEGIRLQKCRMNECDALLLATDGFWKNVREQEILIDYTKSADTSVWLSYLMTRLGYTLDETSDSYSVMLLMMQTE